MWKYRELILYKAYFDLKSEAARGNLGILWWIVEPLLYLAALSVVFTVIRQDSREGFLPFLFVGLVVWKWFAASVSQGSNSIVGHIGLMRQVYIPKNVFPVISLLVNTFKFLNVFILLIVALFFLNYYPTPAWWALPVLILIQFVMLAAATSLLSVIICYVPDIKLIIDNSLLLLFFLSGILFDIDNAPESLRDYLYFNPMISIIENFRTVLIDGTWPDWASLGTVFASSLAVLLIGQLILKAYDRKIPKVVLR